MIKIGNTCIGHEEPCFIIAEMSANHGNKLEIAKRTVEAAKKAGANAIKVQTLKPSTITLDVKSKDFVIDQGEIWDGKKLYDLYKDVELPWKWHAEIQECAYNEGLEFFSSPFDISAVDFLEDLEVPAYKIASFEITDIPLIKYVASKGKPIIISTGVAYKDDIDLAVKTCRDAGNSKIILLKCTSGYPTPLNQANILMMNTLKQTYDVIVGLSDHTLGIVAPITAVALGAKVIEKHFILDKSVGGPDSSFSLDLNEFSALTKGIRECEKALGQSEIVLTEKQVKSRNFIRSLYISKDVKKGEKIDQENVKSVRPGYGMHPKYHEEIIGKIFKEDYSSGTRLADDCIE